MNNVTNVWSGGRFRVIYGDSFSYRKLTVESDKIMPQASKWHLHPLLTHFSLIMHDMTKIRNKCPLRLKLDILIGN